MHYFADFMALCMTIIVGFLVYKLAMDSKNMFNDDKK